MKKIKILCVEDLNSDYELAKHTLSKEGLSFDSIRVDTAEEMLKALNEFKPDLVISDYSMPQFDGKRALKLLLEFNPDIPLIILTGSTNEETAVECLKAGAIDYVIKEHMKRLPFAVKEALVQSHTRAAKRKAERALVKSEKKFRLMAENAHDLIFHYEFQPERKFTYVSPSATNIIGYTPQEHYSDPDFALKIVHPDDKQLLKSINKSTVSQEKPVTLRWIKKDGSIIWTEQINSYILSDDGELVAIEGIVRNITDRILAEEALKESEKKYRLITESSSDVVWTCDLNLKLTYVSPSVVRLFGYSVEEHLNRTMEQKHPPSSVDLLIKVYKEEMERLSLPNSDKNRSRLLEVEHYKADGSTIWIEIKISFLKDENDQIIGLQGVTRDITERKKAQDALRKSEERYRNIFEKAPFGIYRTTPDGQVLMANPAMVKMFGFNTFEEFSKIDLNKEKHHPSFSREDFKKELEENTFISNYESIWKLENGETIYLSESARTVRDSNGSIIYYEGMVEDITDRKRAEMAIKESEERYRTFLNSTTDIAYIKDENFHYVMANAECLKFLKRNIEEVIGKTDFDLLKYEFAEKYNITDKEAIAKEELVLGVELIDNKYYEIRKFPLKLTNNKIGIGCFIRDVTDRFEALRIIEKSELKYRNLVENSLVGVYTTNTDGEFIFANNSLCQIFEVDTVSELYKLNVKGFYKDPQTREKIIEELKKNVKLANYELEMISHKGNSKFITLSSELSGNMISGMMLDITDRKLAEIEILLKNQEIETQNEEYKTLNEELYIAKEKAEESDKLKTAFIQNISHEIRTPMNAIVGFSDLMELNYNDTDKLKYFISVIRQRSEDLLGIINQLLDISRIETGQLNLKTEKVDLNKLFKDIYTQFTQQAQYKDITAVKLLLSEIPSLYEATINTDPGKLKQILYNLINNAYKFTTHGEIKFGFHSIKNGTLTLSVSDTGVGIADEMKGLIFERFRKSSDESIYIQDGLGLGLAIVKGLLQLFGGTIWVDSELNKGSTFYFSIPYNPVYDVSEFPNGVKQAVINWSNYTILLVEDDTYNVAYFIELLKETKIKYLLATTGHSAIHIFEANKNIDLVLMDIKLPDLNGFQVTREFKKIRPEIPVIAQTAYASDLDRQKALDAGCIDFISKPIKQELLFELMNKYLVPKEEHN